jgi:hypothetical protein
MSLLTFAAACSHSLPGIRGKLDQIVAPGWIWIWLGSREGIERLARLRSAQGCQEVNKFLYMKMISTILILQLNNNDGVQF